MCQDRCAINSEESKEFQGQVEEFLLISTANNESKHIK